MLIFFTVAYIFRAFRLRREEQTLPNIKQYFVECISRDQKYQVTFLFVFLMRAKNYLGRV